MLINTVFFNIQVSFDLSLARGLDYYTGMVFEAVLKSAPVPSPDTETKPDPSAQSAKPTKADKKKKKGKDAKDKNKGILSIITSCSSFYCTVCVIFMC